MTDKTTSSADHGPAHSPTASGDSAASLDRRTFLKTAAAAGAGLAAAGIGAGAQAADDDPAARNADKAAAGAPKKAKPLPGDIVVARPGSDFMMDVLKKLDFDYCTTNPGSSFRSLHESMVTYGGNRKPELLTCLHEESSVSIAHGYAKAAGKPMLVMAHGTVGLQHAAMGLYNAWCDRVPVFVVAGNGLDATKRRAGTEWYHSVQDAAAMVRDFVKWDDAPASLQHFAESAVRAYRVATTPPMEPVLLMADIELQESPIEHPDELVIPKLMPARFPQGDSAAIGEAAKWLVNAKSPVIIADRAVRSQEGVTRLVQLAEALGAPVIDLGSRMNFPSRHALCHSDARRTLVRDADVVLLLDVADPFGQFNSISDPHKEHRSLARKDVKIISISMADAYIRANYQDFQRFIAVDMPIIGDVEATLPSLIEAVRRTASTDQRNAFAARMQKLGEDQKKLTAQAKSAAAAGWDAVPISTARLCMETWNAIKDEPWSLAHSDRITWARRLWPTTQYHHMLGGAGGQGVGYGVGGSLGVALANRDKGLFTVTFQPDGDLLYAPGVLWTAAHHKIPILYVMHNNRAYHQETMHLQRMAGLHDRRPDLAWVGTTIDNPNIDFAMLAKAHGMWSEGPITDPAALGPALKRAVAVVKSGQPALVDVVCQPR